MQVLMICRATIFSAPGGDTIQIDATAAYLRRLGVSVDILLADAVFDYSKYDIVHFFNIIRPADILPHLGKMGELPYVVSSIFVDYREYEKKVRGGILGMVGRCLPADAIEYFKALIRVLKRQERISSRYFLFRGQRASIRRILKGCGKVLPNSKSEYRRLCDAYGVQPPCYVIPNAINTVLFNANASKNPAYKGAVISVARIEGLKNQLNLIRAMRDIPVPLFLIGKQSPNSANYYEACKEEAGPNVYFVNHLAQSELAGIYTAAKVHALPSWFETTGLSSLEAAYCGCNIVVTHKGDQDEYFGGLGYFCEPDSIESIRAAIIAALEEPYDPCVRKKIEQTYTWEKTAEKTLEAYKMVLNEK